MIPIALVLSLMLGASPELDEGRLAFSALKYDRALEPLRRAGEDASLSKAERLEAWDLLARAHLALGHAEPAKQAWASLLTLEPSAAVPKGSPKVRASFTQAKEAKFPPRFVQVTRVASAGDVLEAELLDPWALELVIELWEAVGEGEYQRKVLAVSGGRVVSSLRPGSRNYLRVSGTDGVLLASLGTPAEPIAGPAALVSDAPKVVTPIAAPPIVVTEPQVAPRSGLSPRGTVGLVLGGLGLAAAIFGAIFFAIGLDQLNQGNGWPTNNLDYDVAQNDLVVGPQRMVAGGVVGGLGLAAAITGAVLFFTSSAPQSSTP